MFKLKEFEEKTVASRGCTLWKKIKILDVSEIKEESNMNSSKKNDSQ